MSNIKFSPQERTLIRETRVYQIFKLAKKKKSEVAVELRNYSVGESLAQLDRLHKEYLKAETKTRKSEIRKRSREVRDHYKKLCCKETDQYLFVHRKTGFSISVSKISKLAKELLDKHVRKMRREREFNNPDFVDNKRLSFFGNIQRIGLVYKEKGQFAAAFIQKKIGQLEVPKKPHDRFNNYVGVEFEFTSKVDRTTLGLKLFKAGLIDYCELKTDGSLRPKEGECGYEIAALFKESNYAKYLKKLCDVLDEVKAEVEDRRCGLHVHIDVRRRKRDVVYHNLVSCQNLMFKMMPNSRRNGEFCTKVYSKKFPKKFTGNRQERYKSINAAAFYRHGTLEVRMHEGSVNFIEVRNWISFLIKIASYKTKLTRSISSVNILQKTLNLNEVIVGHVRDRINKWNILFPQNRRPEILQRLDEIRGEIAQPTARLLFGTEETALNQETPYQAQNE